MHAATVANEPLLVQVGEDRIEGWLTGSGCPTCGRPQLYVLAFASTCCPGCNVWLERSCPDPDCWHCRLRPAHPRPHPA